MVSLHEARMERIRQLQDRILAKTERMIGPLPDATIRAFRMFPRHAFVDRFRDPRSAQWIQVDDAHLDEHLESIYRDQPLVIWGEDRTLSTISQPSFVLYLLTFLDLRAGDRVFELGAGSGWNAALMGSLCAPGEVHSYEIIASLAQAAAQRIERLGLTNVRIVAGDGMDVPAGLTFNRGIFTAGAGDLPRCFYDVMESESRLLFVFKPESGTDLLLVLNKVGEEFVSDRILECGFVPVTGPFAVDEEKPRHQSARRLGEAKSVRVMPADLPVRATGNQLLLVRNQSRFIWSF